MVTLLTLTQALKVRVFYSQPAIELSTLSDRMKRLSKRRSNWVRSPFLILVIRYNVK